MKIEFSAQSRKAQGTGASRRLRHTGRVPGIVYGGAGEAQPIDLDHNEIFHLLKQESFHASILSMKLDGTAEQVLLRDQQMHPFRQQVMHVDFQRVAKDQKIHMKVPLHFVNAEIAPGVKLTGGLASHVMNEVDITCLPDDLPEFIQVDLANLKAGQSMHLSEVGMPKGVEAIALHRREDPVVATITLPKVAAADETEAAVPEAAAVPAVAQKADKDKKEGDKK